MARTRIVVPAQATGEDGAGVEAVDPEREELEIPDAGDLDHLAELGPEWRWTVYRRLMPAERSVYNVDKAIVGRLEGGIDLMQVLRDYGGGTFEFWGTIKGTRGLRAKYQVALAGPMRPIQSLLADTLSQGATPVVATPPAAPAGIPSELVVFMRDLTQRLDRLERAAQPAAATPITELVTALGALDRLRGNGAETLDPNREVVSTYMDLVKTGIDLGQKREPIADGGTDWGKIIEGAMPLVGKIIDAAAEKRRRGQGHAPASAAAPRASHATVVDDAAGPAAAQTGPVVTAEDQVMGARWITVVDSLARAITAGLDPADYAVTVETLLDPGEVGIIRLMSAEDVVRDLASRADGRYPVLASPGAVVYVRAVLEELNSDGDDLEPTPEVG